MNRNCLIFIGPPLGGKETLIKKGFSKILHRGIHLPMGDKMREESKKGDSQIGRQLSAYMDRGRLVPDEITLMFAGTMVESLEDDSVLLSDGLPRTVGQINGTFDMFRSHRLNKVVVVNIDTPEEECLRRATQNDGSRVARKDDDPDIVRQRLRIYKDKTIPVLRELRRNSYDLKCDVITLSGLSMRSKALDYARGIALLYDLKTVN
jgi:adenylate kinase